MVENKSLMEVAVSGASGYLGQHLIAELINRGAGVRAIVRTESPPADLAVLQNLGAEIFAGKFADEGGSSAESPGAEAVARAFAGADCAVHLIGSVAPPRGGPGVDELHRSYSLRFARACVKAGVKRAVLVTALGADENSKSQYLSSKRQAEKAFIQCLKEAGIACSVVRPSLIVGRLVGRRDSKLVDRYRTILTTRPMVPLVGGGVNMLEPVFVGDLASAIANILYRPEPSAEIIEIGGPQKVSMRQFVETLASTMNISKPVVNMPPNVAAVAAGFLSLVQSVPLLSPDQVKLAQEDMICTDNALPALLAPAKPTALQAALETYKNNDKSADRDLRAVR